MSIEKPNEHDDPEEFLQDLESIKDLLIEQDSNAQDVPMLEDSVEDRLTINEGLPDETFDILLGDSWQDSVDALFSQARARIEDNSSMWLPEDTDDLAEALKIRIDASVRAWLAETLEANIGRLRERVVSELSAELLGIMREKLNHPPTNPPSAGKQPLGQPEKLKDNNTDHG